MPVVSYRRCGIFGRQKNSFYIMIIGPKLLGSPGRNVVTILNELPGSIIIFVIIIPAIYFLWHRKTYRQEIKIYILNTNIYKHCQFMNCVAVLRKCNVMGQTAQSIERNCVTQCGLWHIRRICKAQQLITETCQQAKWNLWKCEFLNLVIIYVAVFWNVMSRVVIAICGSFECTISPHIQCT
jgi:hypothetical protein